MKQLVSQALLLLRYNLPEDIRTALPLLEEARSLDQGSLFILDTAISKLKVALGIDADPQDFTNPAKSYADLLTETKSMLESI